MNTYEEVLKWLYKQVPTFQRAGKSAYKEGLKNTFFLDQLFQYPHRQYKTIHVGGTNGKGSVAHTLASILQESGYNVGLYTSPHLQDFSERIKVNGKPLQQEYVMQFIEKIKPYMPTHSFSFFEITTAMAYDYFAHEGVDIAVIEVGLGGRLDCTNIISPILSIITNISLDHTDILGNTLERIAEEKAGIIKPNTPVVIGETLPNTEPIFEQRAKEENAPIFYAEREKLLLSAKRNEQGKWEYESHLYPNLLGELRGEYQKQNTNTLLLALKVLQEGGVSIPTSAVYDGFARVVENTGLHGRWEEVGTSPRVICDTGHNPAGIHWIVQQLKRETYLHLHIVFGVMKDKDFREILSLLPREATYYFSTASTPRALSGEVIKEEALKMGLHGDAYSNVPEAVEEALKRAEKEDLIFVGGSTYVVADLLNWLHTKG